MFLGKFAQAAEWNNLVGVIAQGSTWQFKGWPYPKGETELFSKVAGYTIRFTDEIPNQLTKGWAVQNLIFSKEKTRKHEVGPMMANFWAHMHTFLVRNKPHLLQKPAPTRGERTVGSPLMDDAD